MNIESKIQPLAAAGPLGVPRPALLVTGYFGLLLVDTIREVEQARRRIGASSVVAAVLPQEGGLTPRDGRARMAAALRVIDYVFTPDIEELDSLIAALQPDEIVRLEAGESARIRQLSENVRRRQIR